MLKSNGSLSRRCLCPSERNGPTSPSVLWSRWLFTLCWRTASSITTPRRTRTPTLTRIRPMVCHWNTLHLYCSRSWKGPEEQLHSTAPNHLDSGWPGPSFACSELQCIFLPLGVTVGTRCKARVIVDSPAPQEAACFMSGELKILPSILSPAEAGGDDDDDADEEEADASVNRSQASS